jgi:hypothetical protein
MAVYLVVARKLSRSVIPAIFKRESRDGGSRPPPRLDAGLKIAGMTDVLDVGFGLSGVSPR